MSNEDAVARVKESFKPDTIREALKAAFSNAKTKINEDASELVREIAQILAVETALRAAETSKVNKNESVSLSDVEAVLATIMLDFP